MFQNLHSTVSKYYFVTMLLLSKIDVFDHKMCGDKMSRGFPKSALQVLRILGKNGPMAPKDISMSTELPLRTVSFALRKLLRWQVCRKIPNLADMRRPLYHVDPEKAREIFMMYGRSPQ